MASASRIKQAMRRRKDLVLEQTKDRYKYRYAILYSTVHTYGYDKSIQNLSTVLYDAILSYLEYTLCAGVIRTIFGATMIRIISIDTVCNYL